MLPLGARRGHAGIGGGHRLNPGSLISPRPATPHQSPQSLHLALNELARRSAGALAEVLPHLTSLRELDLRENELGSRGLVQAARVGLGRGWLARILGIVRGMIRPDLGGVPACPPQITCPLSASSLFVTLLAQGIPRLASLERLDLSANQSRRSGALAVADAVSSLKSLTFLGLDENEFSEEAIAEIDVRGWWEGCLGRRARLAWRAGVALRTPPLTHAGLGEGPPGSQKRSSRPPSMRMVQGILAQHEQSRVLGPLEENMEPSDDEDETEEEDEEDEDEGMADGEDDALAASLGGLGLN